MNDKFKPDEKPLETPDEHPLQDIPVRMNKLPWEREFPDADEPDHSHEPERLDKPDQSKEHAPESSSPYTVGVRTYASQKTAIDSAANEKLFAMGIDEYEEDRSRLKVFFDVLFGKIWKLMSLNMLTGLFNLPALLFIAAFAVYYMQLLQPDMFTMQAEEGGALAFLVIGYIPLGLVFLSIPIVAFGPAQAGMHYILRNYAYETPVFLWSDFKDKMKENFKQAMAVTFINLFVFILALLDIYMYPRMVEQGGLWLLAANYLLIVAFVLFLIMSLYIYPMMIRYDLTLKNLYRNAFLMAIGRFLPNLLVLLLCVIFSYGPFLLASLFNSGIAYFVVYVYHFLLGLTLPGLIASYILNPAMDKVMLPAESEQQEEE